MAGRKIIWSPTAKIDLFEILNYYYKKKPVVKNIAGNLINNSKRQLAY